MSINSENFSKMLNESLLENSDRSDSIVLGKVVDIDLNSGFILVSVGRKSEASIPKTEFCDAKGQLEVEVGDEVEVAFERHKEDEYGFGQTPLSRIEAKRVRAWSRLEKAYEEGEVLTGVVLELVKGGFIVSLDSVKSFLPGSLADIRPIRDLDYLVGKEYRFKIVKMDKRRNNIVVSRKVVLEEESQIDKESLMASLKEGQPTKGVVKNLTEYGAFIDLGGIDGLLHITDMSWQRIKHPNKLLSIGDEIDVMVLKFDREKNRVSLGMKQLNEDPLVGVVKQYPLGSCLRGKVTNVTDYGCFVEIAPGVEGLVHMSEMDWTNRNVHPSKIVQVGDEVEARVLNVDEKRRRISLGIKQCRENPWKNFSEDHKKGDCLKGLVKSITDFGIFVGLEGGIDGLVHLSDVSSTMPNEEAMKQYKKGMEIDVCVLSIDADRERISLGIKQLEKLLSKSNKNNQSNKSDDEDKTTTNDVSDVSDNSKQNQSSPSEESSASEEASDTEDDKDK